MAMLINCLLLFIIFSMGNSKPTEEPDQRDLNARRCPAEWRKFGLRCYKFFSNASNWITAEKNCHSLGATLASVSNDLENDFLLSLLPSPSTRTWIGANDAVEDGLWLWVDGSAFSYTNWCPGEPNNYDHPEDCLEINFTSDFCWNDVSCSASLSYICMLDMCDCVTPREVQEPV